VEKKEEKNAGDELLNYSSEVVQQEKQFFSSKPVLFESTEELERLTHSN
jgi:hypothetical protein